MKPALARGEIQIIGATTIEEYRRHMEKDPALERRFQPVFIDEPNREETVKIIKGISEKYELHHKIKIPDEAINSELHSSENVKRAFRKSERYKR